MRRQLRHRRMERHGRAHRFTGCRKNTTRGSAGRGGLQRWPNGLEGMGHASRPSELAPSGAACRLAACHSHADSTPCRVFPTPYGRLLTRRRITSPEANVMSTYGGAQRDATWGWGGAASANPHACNHHGLDASDEVRLAWPKLPSESGHLCKPSRPAHLRVVSRCAPVCVVSSRRLFGSVSMPRMGFRSAS